ncbi:uncharacterized protein LOC134284166 [Aedes albopictus]|uniref:Uncharacterized protein n=1 Tax=Aedes albopictus TaxID=7160 RepID=A0ABM1ZGD0_AEDAL
MSQVSTTDSKPARALIRLKQLQEERAIQQREIALEMRILALEQKAMEEKYRLLEQQLVMKRKHKIRDRPHASQQTKPFSDEYHASEIAGSRAVVENLLSTGEKSGINDGELNTTKQRSEYQLEMSCESAEQLGMMDHSTKTNITWNNGFQQRNTRATPVTAVRVEEATLNSNTRANFDIPVLLPLSAPDRESLKHDQLYSSVNLTAPTGLSGKPNDGKGAEVDRDEMKQETYSALATPILQQHTTMEMINHPVEHHDSFCALDWRICVVGPASATAENEYSGIENLAKLQQVSSGYGYQKDDRRLEKCNLLGFQISTTLFSRWNFVRDTVHHTLQQQLTVDVNSNKHPHCILMDAKPTPACVKSLPTTRRDSYFTFLVVRLFRWILESHTVTLTDMHFGFGLFIIRALFRENALKHKTAGVRSGLMEIGQMHVVHNAKGRINYEFDNYPVMYDARLLPFMVIEKDSPSPNVKAFVPETRTLGNKKDFSRSNNASHVVAIVPSGTYRQAEVIVSRNRKRIINELTAGALACRLNAKKEERQEHLGDGEPESEKNEGEREAVTKREEMDAEPAAKESVPEEEPSRKKDCRTRIPSDSGSTSISSSSSSSNESKDEKEKENKDKQEYAEEKDAKSVAKSPKPDEEEPPRRVQYPSVESTYIGETDIQSDTIQAGVICSE